MRWLPAASGLMPLWRENALSFVHAVATPYRDRSHFDGQDLLENGMAQPKGEGNGWLNRKDAKPLRSEPSDFFAQS